MRLFCFIILLVVGAAVTVFAVQNQQEVTLTLFNYHLTVNMALLIAATYVLGMLSGWTVIGMLRRSFERATELPRQRQNAAW